MKKSFLFIALIAMTVLLGLNSCHKGDGTVDPSQNDLVVAKMLPDAIMPAFDASTIEVFGSIDEDINVYPEFNGDMRGDMGGRMMDRMHNRMGFGFKMRALFYHLNLTDAQKEEVHEFMLGYHDCVTRIMESTRAAREEILSEAATERRRIIAAFKAGTNPDLDTRQEVMAALHQLNQDTRDKLQALIDRTALCNCFKHLLENVYDVLDTDAQKDAFETWFGRLQNPCFEDGWTPWGRD